MVFVVLAGLFFQDGNSLSIGSYAGLLNTGMRDCISRQPMGLTGLGHRQHGSLSS